MWVSVGSQYGRSWTPNVDKDGCPRWSNVGFQDGQKWLSNVDRMWLPKSAHYRTPISAHYRMPTIACPSWVPIMGAHCWAAILWGYMVAHYWASIRAQLLGIHASPLWVGFLGALFGRMWSHPNGTPTSLVHVASKWPLRCEPI